MIIWFSIKNFGPIKEEIRLSFEAESDKSLEEYYIASPIPGLRLLKLALIYGPNASGKTTILFALDFLRQLVLFPAADKTHKLQYQPFLFDEGFRNGNTRLTIGFVSKGVRYEYAVEFNRDAVLNESLHFFMPRKALVFQRETDTNNQISNIKFGSKIRLGQKERSLLTGNTLWNSTVMSAYLKTNLDFPELKAATDWFISGLQQIVLPSTRVDLLVSKKIEEGEITGETMIQMLRKADLRISGIRIEKEEKTIGDDFIRALETGPIKVPEQEIERLRAEKKIVVRNLIFQHDIEGSQYPLDYTQESAGTKRYFELGGLLLLVMRSHRVLPVDELEASLHPDLIKHLLLTFLTSSKQGQLIATTHYRELLDEKDILRTDAIWFCDKLKDGSTELFSLADFDSGVIRKTSSYYKAYKIGKLGAVPRYDDYYMIDETDEQKQAK